MATMDGDYEPSGSSFRLIDLVIVIVLAAVATGIGLCLLGKLNGPCGGSRIRCNNNIRQIALGMHNCADAIGCMPPYRGGSGHGLPANNYFADPGNEGSAFFFLLPFVEHADLYKAAAVPSGHGDVHTVYATVRVGSLYGPTGTVTTPPTAPFAAGQALKLFFCPTDPTIPRNGQLSADPLDDGNSQMFGVCSYACNYLVFGNPDAVKNGQISNPDGFDPRGRVANHAPSYAPTVPGSFPDGMSNTLLIAERLSQCNWTAGSATGPVLPAGTLWGPAGDNARYAPAFAMEAPWDDGTKFQPSPTPANCNVAYPSTAHLGGMVVAMADGSARAVSQSISAQTFHALCTPNGGDVIGMDF
jgi:hypothetical protein